VQAECRGYCKRGAAGERERVVTSVVFLLPEEQAEEAAVAGRESERGAGREGKRRECGAALQC